MLQNITRSLADLLGREYVESVISARAALTGENPDVLRLIADDETEFYPESFRSRQEELMESIGSRVAAAFESPVQGAPTDSYRAAQHDSAAPLSGYGCFRVGEDGRLYFTGKSEHYHIPLGHGFPGYRLIENAKALGIPTATHNNTRGYITRLTEETLIAAANGIDVSDREGMKALLSKRERGVMNRVINLETGSLAVEAALKMMLSRFYTIDGKPAPYAGRIPVFLVMADNAGGVTAGYHGTTVVAQTLRSYIRQVDQSVALPQFDFDLSSINRVTIVACGTSFYAGMVAKYWFEQFARLPADIDFASEFRYREPVLEPGGLALFMYGMENTSEGIQRAAGDRLQRALNFMTRNRVMAVLTGTVVTIAVQSSSATTVMLVSFVNAGMLTLVQGIGERMRALKGLLVDLLTNALPETTVVGLPADHPMSAGHILSVAFPPVRAETLLHALEGDEIFVGTGSACSSKKGKHSAVLTAMRQHNEIMDGAIRISLCPDNTEEEMRYTAEKTIAQVALLRRFMRR